jgi:hypothetical protein
VIAKPKDENVNEANDFDFLTSEITSKATCFAAAVDLAASQTTEKGEIKASRERFGHRFVGTMVY